MSSPIKEDFQKIDVGEEENTTATNSPGLTDPSSNEQTITKQEKGPVAIVTATSKEENENNNNSDNISKNENYDNQVIEDDNNDEFEDNSKVPKLSYWRIYVLFLYFDLV